MYNIECTLYMNVEDGLWNKGSRQLKKCNEISVWESAPLSVTLESLGIFFATYFIAKKVPILTVSITRGVGGHTSYGNFRKSVFFSSIDLTVDSNV